MSALGFEASWRSWSLGFLRLRSLHSAGIGTGLPLAPIVALQRGWFCWFCWFRLSP